MRSAFSLFLLCAGVLPGAGQSGAPGVTAEWDVRAYMTAMASDIRKLEPMLKEVHPSEWIAKGAPEAYVRQLQASQAGLQGLIAAADKLAQDPERLSLALEAFFQMERMEALSASLRDGVRRYQSADLGESLDRAFAQNAVHRDRLRQYIRDLSKTREQEFDIVNQEAQRCRGMILQQTPPERKPHRSKK